jgi:hypothetical protein
MSFRMHNTAWIAASSVTLVALSRTVIRSPELIGY